MMIRSMPEPGVAGIAELVKAAARYAIDGDWDRYAAARAAAADKPWAPALAGFPADPADPKWTFWRKAGRFDPMVYWPLVAQPVLVILGAEDERANVAVAESVRRLEFGFAQAHKRNHAIHVIEGAGHDGGIYAKPDAFAAAIDAFLRKYALAASPARP